MRHSSAGTAVTFVLCLGCSAGQGAITTDDDASNSTDAASAADVDDEDRGPGVVPLPDLGTTGDASQPAPRDIGPDADPDLGPPQPSPSTFYVAESDGTIHWGTFDPDAVSATLHGSLERGGNQNFLAFDAAGDRLYAANGSMVEAYALGADGTPTFAASADAGIGGTALEIDRSRSVAFVASYGGDAVALLPLDANGVPSDATRTFGGDAEPDFCRRAHQVRVHPDLPFAYVPCLGSDHIAAFTIDGATIEQLPPSPVPAGSGPRHMDFHPSLPIAYVIGELDDTITILDLDPATGALSARSTVSTRPADPETLGPASDVHVAPDGRSVLGINRNPRDELVTFDADPAGNLTFRNAVSSGGEHARTFTFTPSGSFALVGNSNSRDVVVFDLRTAQPEATQTLAPFDSRVMYVGIRPSLNVSRR